MFTSHDCVVRCGARVWLEMSERCAEKGEWWRGWSQARWCWAWRPAARAVAGTDTSLVLSLSELARGVHRATTTRITLLPPTTHTHTLLKHIDGPFWHFLHLSFKVFFKPEIKTRSRQLAIKKKLKIQTNIENRKREKRAEREAGPSCLLTTGWTREIKKWR